MVEKLKDAKLKAADDHETRIKVLTEAADQTRKWETIVKQLVEGEAAGINGNDLDKATYYRAESETRLLREQTPPIAK